MHDWYVAQVAACADGLAAGQQIEVPAEVAEYARQWAIEHFDFSEGSIISSQQGILSGDSFFAFTTYDYDSDGFVSVVHLGSVLDVNSSFVFPSGAYLDVDFFVDSGKDYISLYFRSSVGEQLAYRVSSYVQGSDIFFLSGAARYGGIKDIPCLAPGILYPDGTYVGDFRFAQGYTPFTELGLNDVQSIFATMTKDPALDVPITDDLVATIPDDIPFVQVEDKAIPVISELTREDVLTGEVVKPTTPPTTVPGEQTQVGDIALEDIQAQQASLGAVFISKFPFSIPWDFAAAVELLAAPPKTPHWEVDFMAPLEHRVGSWAGDTTIVIDFSDFEILGQLCRWVTTIMFCAALISGTKRLIWTA